MKKLDFNTNLLAPNGDDTQMNMGKELANGLSLIPDSKNPLKLWEWSKKLYTDGILELDSEDIEILKNTIKESKGWTVMFTGQVLSLINQ